MKRLFLYSFVPVFLILFAAAAYGQTSEKAIIFKAMKDEISRSINNLQLESMQKPYYIAYRMQENNTVTISASFGSLIYSTGDKSRTIAADVRIGDYSFDNTNFSSAFGFGGNLTTFPGAIVTDYDVLRHDLWRTTDVAYKDALESFTKKQAAIQTQKIDEKLDDYTKMAAVKRNGTLPFTQIDKTQWEENLKKLSGLFRKYTAIDESVLTLRTNFSRHFIANSEGSEIHLDKFIITLDILIAAQADDGTKVSNAETIRARSLADFPSYKQLAEKIIRLAEETLALRKAPTLEDYEGPLLFSGQASAAFFSHMLPSKISSVRSPISEDTRFQRRSTTGKLARKLGRRVTPEFISAIDNPLLDHYNGKPLIGTYPFDDEGVVPSELPIIENGILKNYYTSRTPTKRIPGSNGHGRSSIGSEPDGRPGNLIITCSSSLSEEDLKKEFIRLCKDEGLEYGVIIKRLFTGAQERGTGSLGFSTQYTGYGRGELPSPAIAYKVYTDDGREELIRGFEIVEVKVRILKDILFAGNEPDVYNYTDDGRSGNIAASVAAPSIIIEEMELRRKQQELLKPPILANPLLEKTNDKN